MKKVSTVAQKQSRNIFQQKPDCRIGFLGDRNSWRCVVDEAGQIELEQRVRTSAQGLQKVFGRDPAQSDRVGNLDAFALYQSLAERLGHDVIAANGCKGG